MQLKFDVVNDARMQMIMVICTVYSEQRILNTIFTNDTIKIHDQAKKKNSTYY